LNFSDNWRSFDQPVGRSDLTLWNIASAREKGTLKQKTSEQIEFSKTKTFTGSGDYKTWFLWSGKGQSTWI
jgi:hypothetical protein